MYTTQKQMPQRRSLSAHTKRIVAARAKWTCQNCKTLLDETYEIDHIIALHKGGADSLDNLQALCSSCHRKKTIREEMERLNVVDTRRRAPMSCLRCGRVVSPYFSHSCHAGASMKRVGSSSDQESTQELANPAVTSQR